MRRREVLAALAGTVAAAGCSTLRSGTDQGDDGPERITVETLDAPGSDAGTATVPDPERVTFVEFFATTCSVCASQMSTIGDAYDGVGAEVQFLSVTSEPVGYTVSREDIASWWADHGGTWPVAVDDGTALAQHFDASSVPTALVVTPDGDVTWSHTGPVDASVIVEAVRDAQSE